MSPCKDHESRRSKDESLCSDLKLVVADCIERIVACVTAREFRNDRNVDELLKEHCESLEDDSSLNCTALTIKNQPPKLINNETNSPMACKIFQTNQIISGLKSDGNNCSRSSGFWSVGATNCCVGCKFSLCKCVVTDDEEGVISNAFLFNINNKVEASSYSKNPDLKENVTEDRAFSEERVCEKKLCKSEEDRFLIEIKDYQKLEDQSSNLNNFCGSKPKDACCCESIYPCQESLKLKKTISSNDIHKLLPVFSIDPAGQESENDLAVLDLFRLNPPTSIGARRSVGFGFNCARSSPQPQLVRDADCDDASLAPGTDDHAVKIDVDSNQFEQSPLLGSSHQLSGFMSLEPTNVNRASAAQLLDSDNKLHMKPSIPSSSKLVMPNRDIVDCCRNDEQSCNCLQTKYCQSAVIKSPNFSPLSSLPSPNYSPLPTSQFSASELCFYPLLLASDPPLDDGESGKLPDQLVPRVLKDFSHVTTAESLLLADVSGTSEKDCSSKFTSFENEPFSLESLLPETLFDNLGADDDTCVVANHPRDDPTVDCPQFAQTPSVVGRFEMVDRGFSRDRDAKRDRGDASTRSRINVGVDVGSTSSRHDYDNTIVNRQSNLELTNRSPCCSLPLGKASSTASHIESKGPGFVLTPRVGLGVDPCLGGEDQSEQRNSNHDSGFKFMRGLESVPDFKNINEGENKNHDLESIVKLGGIMSKQAVTHFHPPSNVRSIETAFVRPPQSSLLPPPLSLYQCNQFSGDLHDVKLNHNVIPTHEEPGLVDLLPQLDKPLFIKSQSKVPLSSSFDAGLTLGDNFLYESKFHEVPRPRDMTSPTFDFWRKFETSSNFDFEIEGPSTFLPRALSATQSCYQQSHDRRGVGSKWTQFESDDQYVPERAKQRKRWLEEMVQRERASPECQARNGASALKTANLFGRRCRGDVMLWTQF